MDAHSVDHGDVSFDELTKSGICTFYERTPAHLVYERSKDVQIILTNKVVFDRATIYSLNHLSYIGVLATGYNNVDINAAIERGIVVTNVPAYSTQSVAQLVFGFILELNMKINHHNRMVHEGKWSVSKDFCFWDYPLGELDGKVLGIIGFGRIGQAVARIAQAFGMKIIAYRKPKTGIEKSSVEFMPLKEIFERSDIVTLHCPLTNETRGMVNKEILGLMKKEAFIINTSRGPVVNENDLALALNEETISGAGLDVLSTEPPDPKNPLLTAKNCIITPHIGWATTASRQRLIDTAVKNVKAFIAGTPLNVVTV
ncbi:MAG: D-2-hydroxyacid dehydrogenase [Spirochaetales bacterium]|nr:D-2-hydroxyacid dehydrogenase [Spirochaetales bacterium]